MRCQDEDKHDLGLVSEGGASLSYRILRFRAIQETILATESGVKARLHPLLDVNVKDNQTIIGRARKFPCIKRRPQITRSIPSAG